MIDYKTTATEARKKVLEMIYKGQVSHIGSNFSAVDILTVLFERIDLDKDIFVLSKGWAAASLYYFLWKHGRITLDELNSYCQPGSKFIGLAEPIVPEIKIAGGSMGLGLPGAVGLALAKKLSNQGGKVYVLMSDGELAIGTTWESALIAAHHKLDNLVVIVDNNGFQAMGKTSEVLDLGELSPKWFYLGWEVHSFDGHDYRLLEENFRRGNKKPMVLIANTIKGKGVPKWENDNLWHYAQIKEEDYNYALSCLK